MLRAQPHEGLSPVRTDDALGQRWQMGGPQVFALLVIFLKVAKTRMWSNWNTVGKLLVFFLKSKQILCDSVTLLQKHTKKKKKNLTSVDKKTWNRIFITELLYKPKWQQLWCPPTREWISGKVSAMRNGRLQLHPSWGQAQYWEASQRQYHVILFIQCRKAKQVQCVWGRIVIEVGGC